MIETLIRKSEEQARLDSLARMLTTDGEETGGHLTDEEKKIFLSVMRVMVRNEETQSLLRHLLRDVIDEKCAALKRVSLRWLTVIAIGAFLTFLFWFDLKRR